MNPVFLDTGYVLALELANDQNHRAALSHWQSFSAALPPLITTSYVFDEIVTFFNSRDHHAKAVEVGQRLLQSPAVRVLQVDEALFQSWRYFREHQDKRYSFTDCISFVVMAEQAVTAALTFDRHFGQAGFETVPRDRTA